MNDGLDIAPIKTYKNTTGTIYAIIAEKNGLSFSLRPGVSMFGPIMVFCIKGRVHKLESWANLESSSELFGFTEFTDKGPEYKVVYIHVPLHIGVANTVALAEIISKNDIIHKTLDTIYARLPSTLENLTSKEKVLMFCEGVVADILPIPNITMPKDYPVLIGEEAIKNSTFGTL